MFEWASSFDTSKNQINTFYCQDYIGKLSKSRGQFYGGQKKFGCPLTNDKTNNFAWLCNVLLLQCRNGIYVLKKKKNNKIQRIIVSYWCGFDYTHCRLDRVGYCQDNIIIRNSRWTKLIIIIIIKIIINNNKKKSILFFIIIELIRAMQKEFLIIVIIVCAFFLLLHPAITTIK